MSRIIRAKRKPYLLSAILIVVGLIFFGIGHVAYKEVSGEETIVDESRSITTIFNTITQDVVKTITQTPMPTTITSPPVTTTVITTTTQTATTTVIPEPEVITSIIGNNTVTKTITEEKLITTTTTSIYYEPKLTTSTVTYPVTITQEGKTTTLIQTDSITVTAKVPVTTTFIPPPQGGAILHLKFKLGMTVGLTNLVPILPGTKVILVPANYDTGQRDDLEVQFGLERPWSFTGVFPSATSPRLEAYVKDLDGEYGIASFEFTSVKKGYMYPTDLFWTDSMRNYMQYTAKGDYLIFAEKYGMTSYPKFVVWIDNVYVQPPYTQYKLHGVSDWDYLDKLNHMLKPWAPNGIEVFEGVNIYEYTASTTGQRAVSLSVVSLMTKEQSNIFQMFGIILIIGGIVNSTIQSRRFLKVLRK